MVDRALKDLKDELYDAERNLRYARSSAALLAQTTYIGNLRATIAARTPAKEQSDV